MSESQRPLLALAAAAFVIALVVVLYWTRSLLIPIALGIFLTFVLSPLVAWLQHRGLGRSVSVVLVVLVVLACSFAIGAVLAHEVIKIAETLPDRKEAIKEKIVAAKTWMSGEKTNRFGQMVDDLGEVIFPRQEAHQTVVVEPASPSLPAQLQTYISPSAEFLGQTALTLILTVYMLIRREDLRNRMIRLLGDGRVTTTTKAVDEASRRISRYLLMQLIVNATFGLTIALGLFLLGVEYVLLWGFIASIMRYVPYIGTWIGLLPPVVFSFATAPAWGGGWGQPLSVFLLYVSLELLVANVFEPWLYGSSMGLSEIAQLVSTAFWAYLWGPIGLILASPLTVCLLVLGKYVRGASFLEVILGDQPALEPHIAFYQRLAARDQDEAAEIARTAAKTAGPDGALETVVIPALGLVRRDRDLGELDKAAFTYAVHAAHEVVDELEDEREPHPVSERDDRVRVLISPARDEAEAVAAEILAATLDPAKWEVRVAGNEVLASELVAEIEEFQPAVVVLIALPPGGNSHCRYLVKRIRAKFSDVRIVVGRWSTEDVDPEPSNGMNGMKLHDGMDRSLSATRKRLNDFHPVLAAELEKQRAERETGFTRPPQGTSEGEVAKQEFSTRNSGKAESNSPQEHQKTEPISHSRDVIASS